MKNSSLENLFIQLLTFGFSYPEHLNKIRKGEPVPIEYEVDLRGWGSLDNLHYSLEESQTKSAITYDGTLQEVILPGFFGNSFPKKKALFLKAERGTSAGWSSKEVTPSVFEIFPQLPWELTEVVYYTSPSLIERAFLDVYPQRKKP